MEGNISWAKNWYFCFPTVFYFDRKAAVYFVMDNYVTVKCCHILNDSRIATISKVLKILMLEYLNLEPNVLLLQ
jgi:hypothetical protein